MYILKSISVLLSLGLAMSGGLNISSPKNDNFRIVVEPTTGAVISIENEGNCNKLKVNVNMNSGQSEEIKVDYYISKLPLNGKPLNCGILTSLQKTVQNL